MRFVLLDRITELTRGSSITAVKNVSLAEEYLADHFPGFPILPGVLMVEALVQAGGWLMRDELDFRYSSILLKEAKAVRYNNFVAPGRQLVVTVNVKKKSEDVWEFQGSGTVDGASAVSARLALKQFNLADQAPELSTADEQARSHFRGLFRQLWKPTTSTAL